jgi:hypothetical protein
MSLINRDHRAVTAHVLATAAGFCVGDRLPFIAVVKMRIAGPLGQIAAIRPYKFETIDRIA